VLDRLGERDPHGSGECLACSSELVGREDEPAVRQTTAEPVVRAPNGVVATRPNVRQDLRRTLANSPVGDGLATSQTSEILGRCSREVDPPKSA
jgi:hypothetical protein